MGPLLSGGSSSSARPQGMVPRADLAAAVADANAAREELAARARDCAALEAHLARAQEQLSALRAESGQLQLAVSGMAPMADLRAARAEASKWRAEADALRARLDAMAPLADLEAERSRPRPPPLAPRPHCTRPRLYISRFNSGAIGRASPGSGCPAPPPPQKRMEPAAEAGPRARTWAQSRIRPGPRPAAAPWGGPGPLRSVWP